MKRMLSFMSSASFGIGSIENGSRFFDARNVR